MSRLKRLIVETRRRSLWQVLLIYVGGAWVCCKIIDTITEWLTLPDCLPALAIILVLIGLAIVVATAPVPAKGPPAEGSLEAEPRSAMEESVVRVEEPAARPELWGEGRKLSR